MNVSKLVHLKDDEKILRIVRNYWLVYLPQIILGFVLIAAALFLMLPLLHYGWPGVILLFAAVAMGLYYFFRTAIIWYWNVFIITNLRIVDVNQYSLFKRSVAEVTYEKIQDVTYSVDGFLQAVFNFGVVHLETAAKGTALELPDVHDPKDVNHLITETMGWYKTRQLGGAQNEKVADLLATVSDLTDAEAKAFLVAIQQAVAKGGTAEAEKADREAATEEWVQAGAADGAGAAVFREEIIDD